MRNESYLQHVKTAVFELCPRPQTEQRNAFDIRVIKIPVILTCTFI